MTQVKQTYLMILIVIGLFSLAIYSTYAMFTAELNTNNIVSISTSLNLDAGIDEYQMLSLEANSYQILELNINNSQEKSLYYGIWYEIISGNNYNIEAYKLDTSISPTIDIINIKENKNITVVLINNTNKKATLKLGIETSETESLNLNENKKIITIEISKDDIKNQTASDYIKSLYNSNESTMYYKLDNLLFYGDDPNNYIVFNKQLWRIIGIYDNNLKIILNDSIGDYIYNVNQASWNNTNINNILNDLYYNSKVSNCFKTTTSEECNFNSTGLSEESKKYIEKKQINIDKINTTDIDNILELDIITDSVELNVSLLNLTDYINSFNHEESNKESATSWLNDNNILLSSLNKIDETLYNISINNSQLKIDGNPYESYRIKPVIYLKENIIIIKGDGSKENPYVIK